MVNTRLHQEQIVTCHSGRWRVSKYLYTSTNLSVQTGKQRTKIIVPSLSHRNIFPWQAAPPRTANLKWLYCSGRRTMQQSLYWQMRVLNKNNHVIIEAVFCRRLFRGCPCVNLRLCSWVWLMCSDLTWTSFGIHKCRLWGRFCASHQTCVPAWSHVNYETVDFCDGRLFTQSCWSCHVFASFNLCLCHIAFIFHCFRRYH